MLFTLAAKAYLLIMDYSMSFAQATDILLRNFPLSLKNYYGIEIYKILKEEQICK